jgi:uncharacterized LabA/DUF88 family protein
MVFLDFWNYELSIKEAVREAGETDNFLTDWPELPQEILRKAREILLPSQGLDFAGIRIYGSYDPATEKDRRLHRWATNTLRRFPGFHVTFVERQRKKKGAKCPSCHHEVLLCPQCAESMLGKEEKGVDVLIATDMIRFAWEDVYDVGVLVSADRDLQPAVEHLGTKGWRFLHAAIGDSGAVISRSCWARFDLMDFRQEFRREET